MDLAKLNIMVVIFLLFIKAAKAENNL